MEETGELGVTGEINDHIIVPLIAPVTGDGNFDALAALGTYTRVCSHNLTVFLRATTGFAYCLEDHVFVDQMNLILTIALPHQMVAGTPSVHAEHLERDIEHALHYVKDTLQPYGVRWLGLIAPIGNPTDKQTISYVSTVHERTGAEILLYNAPPVVFGGPCFSPEALRELLSMPFVLGVKHSGDEKSGFITLEGCAKAGKRYYEGKETHMALLLRQGAYGIVPSGANVVPEHFLALLNDPANDVLQQQTLDPVAAFYPNRQYQADLTTLALALEELPCRFPPHIREKNPQRYTAEHLAAARSFIQGLDGSAH